MKNKIGVITSGDSAQLYRVLSAYAGLLYLESIDKTETRTIPDSEFWALLDCLE